jgi:O-antigen/teichoic acid export membrane protein
VLYLLIPLFAACQGSLLVSIDICRNFLHEKFAPVTIKVVLVFCCCFPVLLNVVLVGTPFFF